MTALTSKAQSYMTALCSVKPNRRTGSPGNRQAVEFVARTIRSFGHKVETPSFLKPGLDSGAENYAG